MANSQFKDFDLIADFLKETKESRSNRRTDREKIWKEIDRQVAMTPLVRETLSGQSKDWYPDLELPWQFSTLEVATADIRRLKFPRGSEWYSVSSELSEEYLARFEDRRDVFPLIGSEPVPAKLDQETADILVKTTIDHYHRMFDYRGAWDSLDIEAVKYGTYVGRVREVNQPAFEARLKSVRGPALIPQSIKNTWLDDTPAILMNEGFKISPLEIRGSFQYLHDLKRAAKAGGKAKGYILKNINKLEPNGTKDEHVGQVELLEGEGDFIIPKSKGSLFLPNMLITVAIGQGGAQVVRFRKNQSAGNSYITGTYIKDDMNSRYGSSPLMKGQPLQESGAAVLDDLLAASRLASDPVVIYDSSDQAIVSGVEIHPGSQIGTSDPNSIKELSIGSQSDALSSLSTLNTMYEDMTGNTQARRGEKARSHTSALSSDIESTQGISRIDDYVQASEWGPMTTSLYLEYRIIKEVMQISQAVSVNSAGMDGWVNVAADDLPDNVEFKVHGSSGAVTQREAIARKGEAMDRALALESASIQRSQLDNTLKPVILNHQRMMEMILESADIQNSADLIEPAGDPDSGVAAGPGLSLVAEGIPENEALQIPSEQG